MKYIRSSLGSYPQIVCTRSIRLLIGCMPKLCSETRYFWTTVGDSRCGRISVRDTMMSKTSIDFEKWRPVSNLFRTSRWKSKKWSKIASAPCYHIYTFQPLLHTILIGPVVFVPTRFLLIERICQTDVSAGIHYNFSYDIPSPNKVICVSTYVFQLLTGCLCVRRCTYQLRT